MTAQTPERIILDGRPRALYSAPLYRLLASRRMTLIDPELGYNTGCYRRYLGTWEIRDGRLFLLHLNLYVSDEQPLPAEARWRLLRAVPCSDFPIEAHWFNGRLRISIGRRLVYSHHGWSSWFERERVITLRGGMVVRDREVDTRSILERHLTRNPHMREQLENVDSGGFGPLVWFDNDDVDWTADWWPPDYRREGAG